MSALAGVRPEMLALFLAAGIGTYLMRLIPLLAALGRTPAGASQSPGRAGSVMRALSLVAPAVIGALLVSALLPARPGPGLPRETGIALVALVPTTWTALRWRHLGLTVLVGVVSYWAVALVA
ncbi:AzlD domain-containing protein [Carboxydochorda subterranea]|uniref:AzlD domain-containing protein n=1 Tax=Carboxydichorda subterranea TaxID=3109565 RepID=A0ABZ1BUX1_9FIRM|nr:AzlD domain-containing protein [Limnochorda sp. L945t]WRP16562.1 AzlD domain-containing protein [Limnochorda sp. L945t]